MLTVTPDIGHNVVGARYPALVPVSVRSFTDARPCDMPARSIASHPDGRAVYWYSGLTVAFS